MTISQEKKENLLQCTKVLREKVQELRKGAKGALGVTGSPEPFPEWEEIPLRQPVDTTWVDRIQPEYGKLLQLIHSILAENGSPDTAGLPRLGGDNLWLWGGPTPEWGGNLSPDTLVRSAKFFNIENGVYVYGPTSEPMIRIHAGFRRLLCQINKNCRAPGAMDGMTEEDCAETVSRLSLKYPNIEGAMCDDVTTGLMGSIEMADFLKRYHALKKHNPALRMYGVVYAHELFDKKDFTPIQPYLDTVNLWFWNLDEILEYERYMEQFRKCFPGKKILQGIFLHDYGVSDAGTPPELLCYQLDMTRKFMGEGLVEGAVILGDREIPKWPESARAVRDYLRNQK